MAKKRIVVVCPGRGSYTKNNLGYLKDRTEVQKDLKVIDNLREQQGEPTITALDTAKSFKTSLHTKGEHASPLIYSCALADFLSIDQEKYEIVAVTGNSMGWYLSLAFAGVLKTEAAFHLIQTMGSMMKDQLIGGQIIYPVIGEDWKINTKTKIEVLKLMSQVNSSKDGKVYISINLGGYLVIGGDQEGLTKLMKLLEPVEHYPFQLINHGAFHTPLLEAVSKKAFALISKDLFAAPKIPLVDGKGQIWQPYSTDIDKIYDYTLGHQVYKPYDFTAAISVCLKEFAPDNIVLLGPGNSLGGSIGQILIQNLWQGTASKKDFTDSQKKNAFLISMGLEEQRALL